MNNSNFFNLNWNDFIKGFAIAIIMAVITILYDTVQAGSFVFNFTDIWHAAVGAAIAYLFKNLVTNSDGVMFKK